MRRIKQYLQKLLLHLLESYKGEKYFLCGISSLKASNFHGQQLIQHGNAGNNLPGREGKCSNTLPLYVYAINILGFKMVECDVRITLDGVPILCHDPYINRVATKYDGTRIEDYTYISQCTYKELQNYKFGNCKITTLNDLLSLCSQNDVICFIDVNCDVTRKNVRLIFDVIHNNNMMDKVFIETKINSGVEYFMELDENHDLSYQLDKAFSIDGINEIDKLGYKEKSQNLIISKSMTEPRFWKKIKYGIVPWLPVERNEEMKRIIAYGHQKGYIMKVTTINDKFLANYFFEIGIDLVCTDCLLFDN